VREFIRISSNTKSIHCATIKGAQKLLRRLFIGSGVTGVYSTYAAAPAAVSRKRKIGYDNPETSNMYPFLLELSRVSDFAALFYLSQLAKTGCRIFDFGGNTGVLFYNYQHRWTCGLQWTLCDGPRRGRSGPRVRKDAAERRTEFHLEL
jgi:putative methyltransferase (TIGR04325 family)